MVSPGSRLGPYEILSLIGSGGMGEVYRALDPRLGRQVAVKVLPERLASDASALDRFEREARALAALSHPNILAIHDFGRDGRTVYSVSELLEGETLRQRLERAPRPPRAEALAIARQIGAGLGAAHGKNIVHRDLKPENIFLTSDGRLKILDFGLAKRLEGPAIGRAPDPDATTSPLGTAASSLAGTAGYIAPEQLRGLAADARADIFAFGCVLHELLAGRRAFAGATAAETLASVLRDEPEPLEDTVLSPIVSRCLAKDPQSRFASVAELLAALEAAPGGEPPSGPDTARAPSLAVLPFDAGGADASVAALAEELREAITGGLAAVARLRVSARVTVDRLPPAAMDPQEAGRRLRVGHVVAGRLRRRGERFQLDVELVATSDGARSWGHSFDETAAGLERAEREIAESLCAGIGLRLRVSERRKLAARFGGNAEAFRLYLEGSRLWARRTDAAYRAALERFEASIRADPGFAPAHAGIAECYLMLGGYGPMSPDEAFPRVRESAQRALALDPDLPEAHFCLAFVHYRVDWDWPSAEKEFRRALALHPSHATAHHWYGIFLLTMGRFDEAARQVREARAIDPLSTAAQEDAAYILFCRRRFDDSVAEYRRLLELAPGFANGHFGLAVACAEAGLAEEALAHARMAEELGGAGPRSLAVTAYVLARGGRRAEAEEAAARLRAMSASRFVPHFPLALVATALGRTEEAFAELERALSGREEPLVSLAVNPRVDPLRGDPRFSDLLRRIGLPEIAAETVESPDG